MAQLKARELVPGMWTRIFGRPCLVIAVTRTLDRRVYCTFLLVTSSWSRIREVIFDTDARIVAM